MPLSNTTATTLAASPYWDDFSTSKRFHRLLFRPKYAVQSRELTQLQTVLQDQIERLTTGQYVEGAPVNNGNISLNVGAKSLKFLRANVDTTVLYSANNDNGLLVRGVTSGAEGRIVQFDSQTGNTYAAILYTPLNNVDFEASENVSCVNASSNTEVVSITVAPNTATPTTTASVFSVADGVYFLRGHLVSINKQTIILETFTNLPDARIGFEMAEEIITEDDDESLLDPALESINYSAPGSHRLKLTGTLTKKVLTGTSAVEQNADEDFIEICRVIDGVIQNDNKIKAIADIEETLARRTYDESGDYLVRPFRLLVQDQIDGDDESVSLAIERGKAYVRGYEFETGGTTYITSPRPRTTESKSGEDTATFFGSAVNVKVDRGQFAINTSDLVDLHCVQFNEANTYNATHAKANCYQASTVGKVRVRQLHYQSGGGDSNTVYKLYFVSPEFQTKTLNKTGSGVNALSNVVVTAASSTIRLDHDYSANTSIGPNLALGANAYAGAVVTIKGATGANLTYVIASSSVVSNSTTANVTLTLASNAFLDTANTAANVVIQFSEKNIRGFLRANTTANNQQYHIEAAASTDVTSKVGNIPQGNTVVYVSNTVSLLFPLIPGWITANSIADYDYEVYQEFTAAGAGIVGQTEPGSQTSFTINSTSTTRFYPTANGAVHTNYKLINSFSGVPADMTNVSLNLSTAAEGQPQTATFYIPSSNVAVGQTAYIIARMTVENSGFRSKVLYSANTNTASVSVSGSDCVTNTAATKGHIAINVINAASTSVVGLGIADVYAIQAVYAVPDATNTATWVDMTDNYSLDNGQRDWVYDHSSLVLKPGKSHHPTATRMLVMVDRFEPSSANGFFSVDSYTANAVSYENIPRYVSPTNGQTVELRDVLDFRPIRSANAAFANTATNPYINQAPASHAISGQSLPNPLDTFHADYDYYLGRIDKLVLTMGREFKVVSGEPRLNPVVPPDDVDAMTLYTLTYPPYTPNVQVVRVNSVDHRRYTMRDIGRIEKRVKNLEYLVSLSLLEQTVVDKPEYDESDNERFKNGILVDSFVAHNVGLVTDPDYSVSIDQRGRELRPSFTSNAYAISQFNTSNSTNVKQTSDLVTLDYTEAVFEQQPLASKSVNVNQFLVAVFIGSLKLSPSNDTWIDTVTKPSVTVNLFGENENWQAIGLGTTWNDWETIWSGTNVVGQDLVVEGDRGRREWIEITTTESITAQRRTGTTITAVPTVLTRNIGSRVVDTNIVPFIRTANVMFSATGLRPSSNLVALFDSRDVTGFVERANELILVSNAAAASFNASAGIHETITSNVAGTPGTARVLAIRGNVLKIVEANGAFTGAGTIKVTGNLSAAQANVSSYVHWSGTSQNGNSSTITLNVGASSNNSDYVGNTIFITRGTGAGNSATITAYNGSTKVATVDANLGATVARYSIGLPKADPLGNTVLTAGESFGMFRIPNNDTLRFNTGERTLRLADNTVATQATTSAEGRYTAQGLVQTKEDVSLATRTVVNQATTVSENRIIRERNATARPTGNYLDPLAETFIVASDKYPRGVFITSVDIFFTGKDTRGLGITLQIRSTINGYPSATEVLPFAEKTLSPNEVTLVPANTTPNADSSSHRTRFQFDAPVRLEPGQEYALTLITNSLDYTVLVGEMGQKVIGTERVIAEQPYLGSLFKSQNARAWTAEQNEDLMFRINKAVFTTEEGIAEFTVPSSAVSGYEDYDVCRIETGHVEYANTTTSYQAQFGNTSNALVTFSSFPVNVSVDLSARQRVVGANNIILRAILNSENADVSPVFDLERQSFIVVRNKIDDGCLYSNTFTILNCGDGYLAALGNANASVNVGTVAISNSSACTTLTGTGTAFDLLQVGQMLNVVSNGTSTQLVAVTALVNSTSITVNSNMLWTNASTTFSAYAMSNTFALTVNASAGSGANVVANVNSTAKVNSVTVVSGGSDYTGTPTFTWSAVGTTNAVILYRGEDSVRNIYENRAAMVAAEEKGRYISRRVTLADDFDASDLKVYFEAYRPPTGTIDVYYRVLASGDPARFEDKNWILMTLNPAQETKYSRKNTDFGEYEYRTAANTAAYVSNGVNYDRFRTFAVKLVIRGVSTDVPRVRGLRVLALDE